MKLPLGESFASFQGEGPRLGQPAYFLRVTRCTLDCAWCDSASIWKTPGVAFSVLELQRFVKAALCALPHSGTRSTYGLVLTGGSPLLYQFFWEEFWATYDRQPTLAIYPAWVEVETEGKIHPDPFWATLPGNLSVQFNLSPKLSSAGMPRSKALSYDVLHNHASPRVEGGWAERTIWKFAVGTAADKAELLDLVLDLDLPSEKVWVMPVASARVTLLENPLRLDEFALQHGFRYSTRLQVVLWDKTTGV